MCRGEADRDKELQECHVSSRQNKAQRGEDAYQVTSAPTDASVNRWPTLVQSLERAIRYRPLTVDLAPHCVSTDFTHRLRMTLQLGGGQCDRTGTPHE